MSEIINRKTTLLLLLNNALVKTGKKSAYFSLLTSKNIPSGWLIRIHRTVNNTFKYRLDHESSNISNGLENNDLYYRIKNNEIFLFTENNNIRLNIVNEDNVLKCSLNLCPETLIIDLNPISPR